MDNTKYSEGARTLYGCCTACNFIALPGPYFEHRILKHLYLKIPCGKYRSIMWIRVGKWFSHKFNRF